MSAETHAHPFAFGRYSYQINIAQRAHTWPEQVREEFATPECTSVDLAQYGCLDAPSWIDGGGSRRIDFTTRLGSYTDRVRVMR